MFKVVGNNWGNSGNSVRLYFGWSKITAGDDFDGNLLYDSGNSNGGSVTN